MQMPGVPVYLPISPTHLLPHQFAALQIISIVQREGGASLQAPPVEELRAGPFVGLQQYVELMHACRCTDPEGRPQFDTIAERLRCVCLLLAAALAGLQVDIEMRCLRAAAGSLGYMVGLMAGKATPGAK